VQKLIIIDDDPFFHFIVEKIMNRHSDSTTVLYSKDGMSVINHLKENLDNQAVLPDFIFVDISMPLFDGWDFVNMYEEFSSSIYKTIKIHVISSSVNPKTIRKMMSYPFISSYIVKPMTKKILEGILNLN
jgi:response regulator of citrate/malate metabolism